VRSGCAPGIYTHSLSCFFERQAEAGDGYALKQGVKSKDDRGLYRRVKSLCADNPESAKGMSGDKIAAFYDDPVKKACDEYSTAKA
jgi:hypothetical protein